MATTTLPPSGASGDCSSSILGRAPVSAAQAAQVATAAAAFTDLASEVGKECSSPVTCSPKDYRTATNAAVRKGAPSLYADLVGFLTVTRDNWLSTSMYAGLTLGTGFATTMVSSWMGLNDMVNGVFACSSTTVAGIFFDPLIWPVRRYCQAMLGKRVFRMGRHADDDLYHRMMADNSETGLEAGINAAHHVNMLRPFLDHAATQLRSGATEQSAATYAKAILISIDLLGGVFLENRSTVDTAQLFLGDQITGANLSARLALKELVLRIVAQTPANQVRLDMTSERILLLAEKALDRWLGLSA